MLIWQGRTEWKVLLYHHAATTALDSDHSTGGAGVSLIMSSEKPSLAPGLTSVPARPLCAAVECMGTSPTDPLCESFLQCSTDVLGMLLIHLSL